VHSAVEHKHTAANPHTKEFIGAEKYGCSGRMARNLFTPEIATTFPMARQPHMERPF
jgi:hypothetical protein